MWQVQYLGRFEGDFTCSAQWKWRFICDVQITDDIDFSWQVQHLVTVLGDSRTAKRCIFQYKTVAEFARGRSPKRRVRDDDFIVDYQSIISSDYPRSSSDYPRLSSNRLYSWRKHWRHFHLRSSTSRFMWQAQYLVRLEGDFTCSAHWKWQFHMWRTSLMTLILSGRRSIWVTVGGWHSLLRALEMTVSYVDVTVH